MTQNSNRILSILEHVDKIPEGGLEPPPLKRQEPKPCASTNSATPANKKKGSKKIVECAIYKIKRFCQCSMLGIFKLGM